MATEIPPEGADVPPEGGAEAVSAEKDDAAAGLAANVLVRFAYRLLLDREPDEEGLRSFSEKLSSGRSDIRQVVQEILASPEAHELTAQYSPDKLPGTSLLIQRPMR